MEAGDKKGMNLILRQYKLPSGQVDFPAIFNIPSSQRIPVLAKTDFGKINMLIIGALTMAFEAMNLKRGMNEIQILDLSEAIIDSSEEDNLSLEDLMLFLQNLVRGKYEMSYESMDIPKFMKLFDIYREQRRLSIMELRENEHLQFKGMGDNQRTCSENPLSEALGRFGNTITELKNSIK